MRMVEEGEGASAETSSEEAMAHARACGARPIIGGGMWDAGRGSAGNGARGTGDKAWRAARAFASRGWRESEREFADQLAGATARAQGAVRTSSSSRWRRVRFASTSGSRAALALCALRAADDPRPQRVPGRGMKSREGGDVSPAPVTQRAPGWGAGALTLSSGRHPRGRARRLRRPAARRRGA